MNRTVNDLFYSVVPTDYLEYSIGKTNLIISAPHGGGMKPVGFPSRKYGELQMDTYTRRIAKGIIAGYSEWEKPYYIISNIHRSKVDLNRDIVEGAQGNKKAEAVWNLWDSQLHKYYKSCSIQYTNTLYIDIHSHNKNDMFELGYKLPKAEYISLMNTQKTSHATSIDGLPSSVYTKIFGKRSIKATLESFDYKVFTPKPDEVYFDGGRNIEVFHGENVGAIQVEIPVSVAEKDLAKVSYALRVAIERFRINFARMQPNG